MLRHGSERCYRKGNYYCILYEKLLLLWNLWLTTSLSTAATGLCERKVNSFIYSVHLAASQTLWWYKFILTHLFYLSSSFHSILSANPWVSVPTYFLLFGHYAKLFYTDVMISLLLRWWGINLLSGLQITDVLYGITMVGYSIQKWQVPQIRTEPYHSTLQIFCCKKHWCPVYLHHLHLQKWRSDHIS